MTISKKKILILASISTVAIGLAAAIAGKTGTFFSSRASDKPGVMDCSYYFDEANGYTSLYDLNHALMIDDSTHKRINDIKTWGTITNKYYGNSKNQLLIQSTDRNGKSASAMVYAIIEDDPNATPYSELAVGEVVTINGDIMLYNGTPELVDAVVTRDYDSNAYPVQVMHTDSDFWKIPNISEETIAKGTIEVSFNNVTFSSVNGSYTVMSFLDGTQVKAYYGSISTQTDIKNRLTSLIDQPCRVHGYLTIYASGNNYDINNLVPEVLLRVAEDVEPYDIQLDSISVTNKHDSLFYGQSPDSNTFTVMAHFSDGSEIDVSDYAEYSGSDLTPGENREINVSYTYRGIQENAATYIDILDAITSIEPDVDDPYYPWVFYQNEPFTGPRVIGSYYETQEDVTNDVQFFNFDSSELGFTYGNMCYDMGYDIVLYGSFPYFVAELTGLSIGEGKTDYQFGEQFEIPHLTATFIINDNPEEADVSRRNAVTYSGFNPFVPGNQTVTIHYGEESDTIDVTVSGTPKTVTSLEINFYQIQYSQYDEFVRPLQAIAYFNDSTYLDVTDYVEYTGFDSTELGTCTVTATFLETETTFDVEILGAVIDYLEVYGAKCTYLVNDTFEGCSEVFAHYTNGSISDVTYQVEYSVVDMTRTGTQKVYVYYDGVQTSYNIQVRTSNSVMIDEHSLLTNTIYMKYNTANFGSSGDWEYYRTFKNTNYDDYFIGLSPETSPYSVAALPGYLQNRHSLSHISYMSFVYRTEGASSGDSPTLYYGYDSFFENTVDLEYSENSENNIYVSLDLSEDEPSFFRIDGGNATLKLVDLYIEYRDTESIEYEMSTPYENEYRIEPTVYEGELVPGVSYVDVPVSINYDTGTMKYTVSETKRYTYYTFDYVNSEEVKALPNYQAILDDAAMTAPEDVAAYYVAFGTIPANYGLYTVDTTLEEPHYTKDWTQYFAVAEIFGNRTRGVAKYNKTDGYATSVPELNASVGYYEFDIAFNPNSYYNGTSAAPTRGVVRVVGFIGGINVSDYSFGSYRVCYYTDDHYATFSEYNNYGGFLSRFKAQYADNIHCGAIWYTPHLLTLLE